jgi:hypothetical protein
VTSKYQTSGQILMCRMDEIQYNLKVRHKYSDTAANIFQFLFSRLYRILFCNLRMEQASTAACPVESLRKQMESVASLSFCSTPLLCFLVEIDLPKPVAETLLFDQDRNFARGCPRGRKIYAV